MPRAPRTSLGGEVYHVLNRANGRLQIFDSDQDYADFQDLLIQAVARTGTRLLAWCLMPNQWHLMLWPKQDGELSTCLRWLSVTHTNRRHAARGTIGTGHLYQGRFKSFVVQGDQHLWTVCRYVERNALRAGLVQRAEDWRWSSAHQMAQGNPDGIVAEWPIARPNSWLSWVNEPQTQAELDRLRISVQRGSPFGAEGWVHEAAERFGVLSTLRARGRPKIKKGS